MLPAEATRGAWYTLEARCPSEFRGVWEAALEKARLDGITHPITEIEAFMIIEMLAADYLAGP